MGGPRRRPRGLRPKVEHALSGAGWEATGSESVQARETIDREFGGLSSSALTVVVHSPDKTAEEPAFEAVIAGAQRTLAADPRVTGVIAPEAGRSISRDGHTAVIQAGAGASANSVTAAMTAACVLGAVAGAQLAGRLPQRALGRAFALLVLAVAGYLLLNVGLPGGPPGGS